MTIETNLGKEKIEVDLDSLIRAYYEIDEIYILSKHKNDWNIADRLNAILINLESATGLEYFRTLRKSDKKLNDTKK